MGCLWLLIELAVYYFIGAVVLAALGFIQVTNGKVQLTWAQFIASAVLGWALLWVTFAATGRRPFRRSSAPSLTAAASADPEAISTPSVPADPNLAELEATYPALARRFDEQHRRPPVTAREFADWIRTQSAVDPE